MLCSEEQWEERVVRCFSSPCTRVSGYAYVYDGGDNMLSKTVDGTLTTFAYTVANELTTQTSGGATTTMTYDAWGQLTGKAQGGYAAGYDWRYGHKLSKVTSNFPGEGTVRYEYRGDGRRHYRLESPSGAYTRYNYDLGWNVVSEGDASNVLQNTITYDNPAAEVAGCLAEIAGSSPETGTAKYYFRDHLGSTRRLHAANKSTLATTEYQPYGETYSASGTQPEFSFTGKAYDNYPAMYCFPYRHYSPSKARWISRDPLGDVDGPNEYVYVHCQVLVAVDGMGGWMKKVHGPYAWPDWYYYFDDSVHFPPSEAEAKRGVSRAALQHDRTEFEKSMHTLQDYFAHTAQGVTSSAAHGLTNACDNPTETVEVDKRDRRAGT